MTYKTIYESIRARNFVTIDSFKSYLSRYCHILNYIKFQLRRKVYFAYKVTNKQVASDHEKVDDNVTPLSTVPIFYRYLLKH